MSSHHRRRLITLLILLRIKEGCARLYEAWALHFQDAPLARLCAVLATSSWISSRVLRQLIQLPGVPIDPGNVVNWERQTLREVWSLQEALRHPSSAVQVVSALRRLETEDGVRVFEHLLHHPLEHEIPGTVLDHLNRQGSALRQAFETHPTDEDFLRSLPAMLEKVAALPIQRKPAASVFDATAGAVRGKATGAA
ncbi:MAG: hypothetical protein ACYCW6_22725 [Candidatus Xenobia bacterium]